MEKIKKYITKQNIIIIFIMLFATILSSLFIFDKILYNGVDTQYHLSRIIGITNSWKANDFFAFIHSDQTGYGYAMGFFYSNLFMILPSVLYMTGMDLFVIYKIFIFLCGLLTAISMYMCVKKITKNKYTATIAMFLYTTCSYRIITMVAKAFIGELLSFIFIPIIILGLYHIIFDNEKKWWVFALGFVGILHSNLVMTEIMIAVTLIIILCNANIIFKNKKKLLSIIKATAFALLLSASLWMPLIEQLCNSTFQMKELMHIYNPRKWAIGFQQLFFGTIQYKSNLASAYGLGIIFILILPFKIKIKEQNNNTKFCEILILIGLLLLICMTNIIPWKSLANIGGAIQFQSRFEVVISAVFCISCGIICSYINKKNIKIGVIIFVLIWQTVASVLCYNSCIEALKKYNKVETKEEIKVEENFEYNICDGVYLPVGAMYRDIKIKKEIGQEEIETNNEELIYNYEKNNLEIKLEYENNNKKDTYIKVPMYYYYGYVAESNNSGENYAIEKAEDGTIKIYLQEESDTIKIYYKTTNIQTISYIITILTLIITSFYKIKNNKKRIKNEEIK